MKKPNDGEQEQSFSAKKRQALLRYMAVLFAAAFVLVLLSFLIQMRNNRTTISELNATNNNALANAQKLQETNQYLLEQNATLQSDLDAAEAALDAQTDSASQEAAAYETELDGLRAALAAAEDERDRLTAENEALEAQAGLDAQTQALQRALIEAAARLGAGDGDGARAAYAEAQRQIDAGATPDGEAAALLAQLAQALAG